MTSYTASRPFHIALYADLPATGALLRHITPNWFASVMGTGIVANAAAVLPLHIPGMHEFATAVWVLAAAALVTLTGVFAGHWLRHRAQAKAYAAHPVMGQFYGAPPMAILTVGAGTLLYGPGLVGEHAAVIASATLWTFGTALGLLVAVWLPFAMVTSHDHADTHALPAWMMPVVSPMVSASTGAPLLGHLGVGQAGMTLLVACYGMFGLSLLAGFMTLLMMYSQLVHGGLPGLQAVPTVWIALGVVGQSITAANLLAAHAGSVLDDATLLSALHAFGIVYGLVMGGFGAFVFALATAVTVHAARRGLSFTLTWWSFTFPVGTCVTGAAALGAATGAVAVSWLAAALYVLLLTAWITVATNTFHGVRSGRLLRG